jgi:hypothetical protein
MRDEKHKNTLQWYIQNLLEPLNTWLKRAKWLLKSRFLGAKSGFWGHEKLRICPKLER